MATPSVPLDAIRQPAVLIDAVGRIIAANELAEAHSTRGLMGLSAEDLTGIFDVRSPDGGPVRDVGSTLSRALAGEVVAGLPFAVTLTDGRRLEILATVSPVREGVTVGSVLVLWQDVTARLEADRALRESEERLRLAQMGAGIGIWDRDRATDRIVVAPGFFERYGLDAATMTVYQDYEQFIHPDDRAMVEARRRAALAAGEPIDLEFRVVLPSGEVAWIRLMARELTDARSPLGRVAGVIIDVTDSKRAEAALRESEERYRELVEQAGSIILRFDLDGRITFVNEFSQRFFGYASDEILGRNVVGTIIPETESSTGRDLAEMVRDIVRTPDRYAENENENIRKNGERVWVRWTNRAIVKPDGTVREILSVGTDSTGRRRAEEALVESEADARSFFKNMIDPCAICEMVVDERGEPADIRLVDVNPAFEQTLSLPSHLIIGQTAFMIFPAQYREWLDLFLEVSRQRTFIRVEDPHPALDRWYHVTGSPVRHGRVAVVFRDITAERTG